jgi:hypothetical protein
MFMKETTSDRLSGCGQKCRSIYITGYGGSQSCGTAVGPLLPAAAAPRRCAVPVRVGLLPDYVARCERPAEPMLLVGRARSWERWRSGRAVRRVEQYEAVDWRPWAGSIP